MYSQLFARSHTGSLPSMRQARKSITVTAAADNQLLKKPDLKRTESEPKKLFGDAVGASIPSQLSANSGFISVEYQRQRAKEIRQYFLDQRNEELRGQSNVFGWTRKNEINNGRWVMFGLLVGLLTEYATGVDFIDQLKLMVSYLGISDFD